MNRWATFLIVAFVAAVLLALTGCREHKTVSAPAESCTSQPTGETREQQTMVCFAFDAKTGGCTVWMPQYYTYAEYSTVCNFKEWK